MATKRELVQEITEIILETCKSIIHTAKYDCTFSGTITERISNGKYKVRINGTEYACTSCCPSALSVGDIVYATMIQNNTHNIIVHKSSKL